MKNDYLKYSFAVGVVTLLCVVGCNSPSTSETTTTSLTPTTSEVPIVETEAQKAIEKMSGSYVIQVLEQNPYTSKMYYADYISYTDNAIMYHKKNYGYVVPEVDKEYLHYFEVSRNLTFVYGRVETKDLLTNYSIYPTLSKYAHLFKYNSEGDYYDMDDEEGVYDVFKYFGVEFNIDAYGTGSNIWLHIDENGNLADMALMEVTDSQAYNLYTYHFANIGTHTLNNINEFNSSGKKCIDRISELKGFSSKKTSYYKDEIVTFDGIVSASVGNTYVVQDDTGLGIKVESSAFKTEFSIGNRVSITGKMSSENNISKIVDVTSVVVNGYEDEITVYTDDLEKYGRYGYYASTYFYGRPQYGGSLYNTGFAFYNVTAKYDPSKDYVATFNYPEVTNGEGDTLKGAFRISKDLNDDVKQMMKKIFDNMQDGDRFVVKNILANHDPSQIYNISFEVTNQTYIERDLTLEEKMVVYLGEEIPLPQYTEGCYAGYISDSVFASNEAIRDNFTIMGVYYKTEENAAINPMMIAMNYLGKLENAGFERYDHFGEYRGYEFYCYVKGESVIEYSFVYVENSETSGTLYLRLCLYKGTPIVPITTLEFIEEACGDANFVLPEGMDNFSFSKYKYEKIYGSYVTGALLYHRNDNSFIDEYRAKLEKEGYSLSTELPSYKSRNRIHYVYVKDSHYIDITESLKNDYMHGRTYELNYRLEILLYISSSPLQVQKGNDMQAFFDALNEDSLLDMDGASIAKHLPKNFKLPEGVETEVFFTRNTYGEGEPLTGGYNPTLYIYCTEQDGSYDKSIEETLAVIDEEFIDAGYTKKMYPVSDYHPKGAIHYSILPPGYMYDPVALTITTDEASGLILIRGL